jgi:NifU-like protein
MGKGNLIGGTLWDHYSRKVAEHMNEPKYFGELSEEDAKKKNARLVVADWGAESCGDAVRLFWLVDPDTDRIIDGRFKSFGCGTAIASSDIMIELCLGKTVEETLKITNIDVEAALRDEPGIPAVPPQKMHCSVMAYDVIKQAAAVYKGVDKEYFDEQEMVCECARVTLGTIQDVIRINDLHTVEEITAFTKAGAFCKSCIKPGGHETRKSYLEDILRDTRAQMEHQTQQNKTLSFDEQNLFQKGKMIETVINAQIRPMLNRDGGDMELLDLTEEEDNIRLSIRYLGNCAGCMSSRTGTFNAIEQMLQKELSEKIQVSVE